MVIGVICTQEISDVTLVQSENQHIATSLVPYKSWWGFSLVFVCFLEEIHEACCGQAE